MKKEPKEIAISAFKAKCLSLLERVRTTRTPLRVTRFGRPVADVVPIAAEGETPEWLGSLSEVVKIKGDIVSSVIEPGDLEALQH